MSVTCVWRRYFCRWRCQTRSQQFWGECRWFRWWRWMFFRLGQMSLLHNWRVITAMRANSAFFFFSLPPLLLCAGDWAEFQSLLFSHSDSVARRKKKKKVSFSHIHAGNSSFCFLRAASKDSRSERRLSPALSGLSLPACHGRHPWTFSRHSLTHTLTLFDIPLRLWCLLRLVAIQSACLSMHILLLIYSPCNLFIRTFCFLSIWSAVLEPGTCVLQQDVGFVLTRLISCRRRHRLIKIIPCYRGCFGQPNDTGGLLCSTDCSRSANGAPRPRLAPN